MDWHRLNLKRRLKGLSPLSQDDFECQSGTSHDHQMTNHMIYLFMFSGSVKHFWIRE